MKYWLILTALLLIGLAPTLQAAPEISAQNAWVRAAPPGVDVLAAYLSIDNHDAQPHTLSGVSSPQFDSVEIHRTEIKDGVATMIAEPRVAIPAHGNLKFEPNGYHLMLIGSRKALHAGDHVELQLQFENHAALQVRATVRADDTAADDPAQHQHHH